jgi:uncharacterized protein YbbC (DUF1343 family)
VGLERLEAEGGARLRGKRLGLLAHGASVTAGGRHAIDVLRDLGLDLRRLFGPEHGLRGRTAAGEKVGSGVDAETGLPVVSLYGEKTKPSSDDLGGLDTLVVDLQDAGVRFYTYASTILLCLEAATDAEVEVVVLDRPNPLGGERMEGPERDPAMAPSLVSMAPGPLVHGLTVGELARLSARRPRRERAARLTVLPMTGWVRAMTWELTGRPWVSPSPNLRSPEAALAYPGTCLLEATNVSEGRGTEETFLLLGAPWVKAEALARAVDAPGFRLEPASFTPKASPAAPKPKHEGRTCAGVRVHVVDPGRARPYAFGLRLLSALRRLDANFAWSGNGAPLDALLGTRSVRAALERGDPVEAILAADAPAIERFGRERQAALLY